MIQEKLTIRDFGPISNVEVAFYPLTIIIGDQGSGKSTLSKVLTICRDTKWWLLVLEENEEEVLRPFRSFAIDEFFCDKTYIHYQNESGDTVVYERGKFHFHLKGAKDVEKAKRLLRNLISETTSSLMERTGDIRIKELDANTRNLLRANTRMGLYVPAERSIAGLLSQSIASIFRNGIPLPDVVLEYMSIFEKAKKEFSVYEVPFLKVKYMNKDGQDRLVVSENNREFSIKGGSSGLQSVLPMMMVIDYSRKKNCFDSFVIEEPEQNLFPSNQRDLLFYIVSKINVDKCNFVITTHSPYLLSCLNVQLLASKLYGILGDDKSVEQIVAKNYSIATEKVAVYALGGKNDENEYCKSLKSIKTGLISVNELDSVSEYIGDDFERLYSLYLQSKQRK